MTRIGVAYGASPITFLSLAGVGDLFLTCSSEKSRNFTVGFRLGKGEQLQHILNTLGSVAEGVPTAEGYKKIIDRVGVDAPIASGVYKVLYEVSWTSIATSSCLTSPVGCGTGGRCSGGAQSSSNGRTRSSIPWNITGGGPFVQAENRALEALVASKII